LGLLFKGDKDQKSCIVVSVAIWWGGSTISQWKKYRL